MTYRILLTDRAARDIDEAHRWYAERAPKAAVAWYNGFLDALNSLATNPERCPLAGEPIERFLSYGNRQSWCFTFAIPHGGKQRWTICSSMTILAPR
jgi:plasmid stabilization system protein ParE